MITYDSVNVNQYKKLINARGIDEIIPIIYNKSEFELDEMDMDEYSNLIKGLAGLRFNHNVIYHSINYEGQELKYKNIFDLNFGEYIDLINYIKGNEIEYIYAIFFRRIIDTPPLSTPILEDYSFNINYRANIFKNYSIKYFFQIKKDIEKLDEIIQKRYSIIFQDDKKEIITNDIEMDERVKAQFIHEQKIKESFSKNAWEYTVYSLANQDITKYEQIYNTNLFLVLNVLKMQRELELKQKKRM